MRLTDYALIFIAILIPIVVIVFVQTSFVLKAEKEELYYKGIVSTALTDATLAMKQVENEEGDIDYGYSGDTNNKVSVNAEIGINTFFSTMFNNMGIGENHLAQLSFKKYIPVVAVIDYDGIYIHSANNFNGEVEYNTSPKVKFFFDYYIKKRYI